MYFVLLLIWGLHKILLLYTWKNLKFFCNIDIVFFSAKSSEVFLAQALICLNIFRSMQI